jgi:hypothetical protein
MITQRRLDELQLLAQQRAEEIFTKWQAAFWGKRAEREEEPEEEVEILDEELPEVENA